MLMVRWWFGSRFGFEGHQKFQYDITWEMGVEFNAPQRRVVGKGGCLMSDTSRARVHFMYLLLLSNFTEASHYNWGATVLSFFLRALDQAVNPLQSDIGGFLLLL